MEEYASPSSSLSACSARAYLMSRKAVSQAIVLSAVAIFLSVRLRRFRFQMGAPRVRGKLLPSRDYTSSLAAAGNVQAGKLRRRCVNISDKSNGVMKSAIRRAGIAALRPRVPRANAASKRVPAKQHLKENALANIKSERSSVSQVLLPAREFYRRRCDEEAR